MPFSSLTCLRLRTLHSTDIETLFNGLFRHSDCRYCCATELIGGADEPIYIPSEPIRQIFYRADYTASALHEVSHWCVAGIQRRCLEDYGYWYAADGRNAQQQHAFEKVEAKPQALEWIFSKAAFRAFRVSVDNLDSQNIAPSTFNHAVLMHLQQYLHHGLPRRAQLFAAALHDYATYSSHHQRYLDPSAYSLDELD